MSIDFLPDFTFTASFASGDQDLDLTANRDQFTIQRGSQSPSLTGLVADPGTFTTPFDNYDRNFDSQFTGGLYYPDIVPGVPLAAVGTWPSGGGGTDFSMFQGPIILWPQDYGSEGFDQSITLTAYDAMRALGRAQLKGGFPRELTGDRISDILTAIGYSGAESTDPGTAYVPKVAAQQSSTSAMSMISDAVNAEWAYLWVDPTGQLIFLDRNGIAAQTSVTTPQAIFGDDPTSDEFPYVNLVPQYDDTRTVNSAVLNYGSSAAQATFDDLVSQGKPWGFCSWSDSIPMSSGPLARSYVKHIVHQYTTPTPRWSQIIVDPLNDPDNLWPVVLSLDIGQQITIRTTPLGGGDRIEANMFIRGIEHAYANKSWTTTYTLDDANLVSVFNHYDDGFLYDGSVTYAF